MRSIIFLVFLALLLSACSNSKRIRASVSGEFSSGHTRTQEIEFLDEQTYKLVESATDKTYGYNPSNPIKVGGAAEMSGPLNERRFLNGLSGPNGEAIQYHRTGSCCGFKTPNGFNNHGMLDRYKVYWEGCQDTAILYLNMYDKGDLKVPVGFKAGN